MTHRFFARANVFEHIRAGFEPALASLAFEHRAGTTADLDEAQSEATNVRLELTMGGDLDRMTPLLEADAKRHAGPIVALTPDLDHIDLHRSSPRICLPP